MIGRRELIGSIATSAVAGMAAPALATQSSAAGSGLRVAQLTRRSPKISAALVDRLRDDLP